MTLSSPAAPAPSRRHGRKLAAAACAVLSLTLVAACGSSKSGTASTASTGSAAKPTEITFWSWTKNSDAVVAKFNATHTDVHVTYSQITSGTDGYAKIFAAIKAGNGPDLFNCEYSELPNFVSQGDVQDITQYVPAGVTSKFAAGAVQSTTLDGKTWAVPYDVEPQVLYYRKDLFQKYHLTVPTTWDQFKADAVALNKADPKAKLVNFATDDASAFAGLAWQAGAQWFSTQGESWKVNFQDAATLKVASYWQGLIDAGLVGTATTSDPALAADTTAGNVLAQINGPFEAAYLKTGFADQSGKWAVAQLPTWDGTPAAGAVGGSSYAVSKDSKNAAAAAEFATWMSTDADAVATRVQGGASSALPADSAMADVAQKSFDSSFYGGQDVYALNKQAATTVKTGWTWGPTMVSTWADLATPWGRLGKGGTIAAALKTGQEATVQQIKAAGLSVSNG
ncbi:ABC transporter substrate-binding protein [Streptacidiphilus carbonis]|uniref:ABC transporter substrate-binding protein n=1 Tax=Streptacidiphilus carbonis TaxID=105422 RepID=UPI0005A74249|nr:sugar ABC transporter substrate-binding protein [Streptacidiphilus carbonis]